MVDGPRNRFISKRRDFAIRVLRGRLGRMYAKLDGFDSYTQSMAARVLAATILVTESEVTHLQAQAYAEVQ